MDFYDRRVVVARLERDYSLRDVYIIGSDDSGKVVVYGEDDLFGSFEISGICGIAYPLIGEVEYTPEGAALNKVSFGNN